MPALFSMLCLKQQPTTRWRLTLTLGQKSRSPPPQPYPLVKDLYGLDKDKPAELSLFFLESEVLRTEEANRQQNGNPTWLDQRKGQITASKAYSVLTKYKKIQKGLDTGNMNNIIDNILGENTLNPNLRPLKYGRKMEPVAREQCTKVMTTKGHLNQHQRMWLICSSRLYLHGSEP